MHDASALSHVQDSLLVKLLCNKFLPKSLCNPNGETVLNPCTSLWVDIFHRHLANVVFCSKNATVSRTLGTRWDMSEQV
jgi:hypothetical protein